MTGSNYLIVELRLRLSADRGQPLMEEAPVEPGRGIERLPSSKDEAVRVVPGVVRLILRGKDAPDQRLVGRTRLTEGSDQAIDFDFAVDSRLVDRRRILGPEDRIYCDVLCASDEA